MTRAAEIAQQLRDFDAKCSPGLWEHEGEGTIVTKESDLLVSTPAFLRFVGGADGCRGSNLIDADFIAWMRNHVVEIAALLETCTDCEHCGSPAPHRQCCDTVNGRSS